MELLALRWIYGKAVATKLGTAEEAQFEALVADLRKLRGSVLGAEEELTDLRVECQTIEDVAYCMTSWTEQMPTDGTRLEVIQGLTTAADQITGQEIADASALRAALVAAEERSATLKDKAIDKMTEAATVGVQIGAGTPPAARP